MKVSGPTGWNLRRPGDLQLLPRQESRRACGGGGGPRDQTGPTTPNAPARCVRAWGQDPVLSRRGRLQLPDGGHPGRGPEREAEASCRPGTAARRRNAHRYHELLRDTPLRLPREAAWAESVYHCYVVRHPQRDRLREHLEKKGVGTALHYPVPLHLQKCFAGLGYQAGDFPVAERAAHECLSLPIYPELTDGQASTRSPR